MPQSIYLAGPLFMPYERAYISECHCSGNGFSQAAQAGRRPRRMILDVDTGVDDAWTRLE